MEKRKIALIGCGSVGSSFIYSSINQGLAQEYILIDAFKEIAQGNALDFSDAKAALQLPFYSIKAGDYSDLKDVDILVITAGRPQKPNETRLDMVKDNAKIMEEIALKVKKSGFKGISIVASNPVDILTTVYQKMTKFDIHKVIGSGTILDTLRLRNFIGEKLNISSHAISAFVIGEHGDSSLIPWSCTIIANKTIDQQIKEGNLKSSDLISFEKAVVDRAYNIINLKKATFYGIGAALALIVKTIIYEQNNILIAGAYLEGQYENKGFYVGIPVVINENGWERIVKLPLNSEEQKKFNKSCAIIKDTLKLI